MKAEIICIGTELLLGHIINSNASFISKKLAGLGIDHYYQTTV
ncbi:MAG: molybdopterin-binding protein, partial [Candidatus Omnitrophica bacterium]|nr:molybdopterin-binding protein [Candidatus Omnitrophota bacterium]